MFLCYCLLLSRERLRLFESFFNYCHMPSSLYHIFLSIIIFDPFVFWIIYSYITYFWYTILYCLFYFIIFHCNIKVLLPFYFKVSYKFIYINRIKLLICLLFNKIFFSSFSFYFINILLRFFFFSWF